ncbi:MAG: right-handed parallel beta-helix repeat-containing protein [Fibrobacteria bacterium]
MKPFPHKLSGFALAALTICCMVSVAGAAKSYYVAPTGGDGNPGTKDSPFASLDKGQAAAQPGDTVFLRGGTYDFRSSSDEIGITFSKKGTSGSPIHYFAFPGEVPVLDFKNMTAAKRIKGVLVKADWLHLKGIEMKNIQQSASLKAHENWCLYLDPGNNNIFENLNIHHNMGPGVFVMSGGNNLFLNCDSHDNYDAYSYSNGSLDAGQNADGFGVHVREASSTGNVFRGCRAWFNADDGWDFINCFAAVTVENCWAWGSGYKADTNPPQSAGNGNGFKVGGFGNPPSKVPPQIPQHTIRYCLGFNNRAAGFYQNHHPISNYYYNNTSFNNKSANYNLLGYKGGDASMGILRNNIAYKGTALSNATSGSGVDASGNSWNLSVQISDADFESIDSAGVYGARLPDGSLPNIGFMKLKKGSDLIDKGTDLKLGPFVGSAPDLGAFEFGALSTPVFRPGAPRKASLTVLLGVDDGRDLVGRLLHDRARVQLHFH